MGLQCLDPQVLSHGLGPVLVQLEGRRVAEHAVELQVLLIGPGQRRLAPVRRLLLHHPPDAHPGGVGVFHAQAAPHTPLGAGGELDKVYLRLTSVLDLLQHLDGVLNAVHRQIFGGLAGMALAAGNGQSDAGGPGGEHGPGVPDLLHGAEQTAVQIPDGKGAVQHRFFQSLRIVGRRHLGGAGDNGEHADLLRRQAGLPLGLPPGQDGGQLHGQDQRIHMVDELGKADLNEPQDGGAIGGDQRHGPRLFLLPAAGVLRQQLGRPGRLKYPVKAHLQQSVEHQIDVPKVLKLAVERRLGHCHPAAVAAQLFQVVAYRLDGPVGTDLDAPAAVDTPVSQNGRLSPADPDGLGRAVFNAGRAAPAAIYIQDNSVLHAINSKI